jgi:RNA polymerase sigma-70 factor (ECF subfamily)
MRALVWRLAEGDETAFAECYRDFADRLYRYLFVRLRDKADAADSLQNVFLRLARHRDRLRDVRDLGAYLFGMARNEAVRLREHQHSFAALQPEVVEAKSPQNAVDVQDAAAAALARLDAAQREIVELKIFAGCTFREVAEILELPQGTVATRYRTALEHMRAWLTQELLP